MDEDCAGTGEWLDSLRVLAAELKAIPSGASLHDQLIQILEDWQSSRSETDNRHTILLSFFLGGLSEKDLGGDVAHLVAQIIQAQLSRPGVSNAATNPNSQPAPASNPSAVNDDRLGAIINTLQRGTNTNTPANPQPSPTASHPTSSTVGAADDSGQAKTEVRKFSRATDKEEAGIGNKEIIMTKVPTYPEVERRVNSAYRLHLDRKHDEIEKIQEMLAQKATEAISQNKEFGALLEIEHAALQQANTIGEIEDMKQILIGGTQEIIDGQRNLAENLQSSFEYLQVIKTDSVRLHDELNKVRLLSLTDEYTGLPNRRAFMRRLEDEIARVKRYNTPLTLVILDLDHFKDINDQYGHPAGDAVLLWYAQNALPMFRHYDMVARYGGEEFAVLFPNTSKDGAIKALEKMHKHIENAQCEYDGAVIDAPTYSAGLTTFQDGDTPSSLIKRADQALYLAKNRGRDRVEMVLPEQDQENSNNELS